MPSQIAADPPNVVRAQAEVLYLIRAPEMTDVQHIYDRVAKIAEGAALMTETTVECRFDKACSSYLPNRTLENAMYQPYPILVPRMELRRTGFLRNKFRLRSPPTIGKTV